MLQKLLAALGWKQDAPAAWVGADPTGAPGPSRQPAGSAQPVPAPDAEARGFYAGLLTVEPSDDLQSLPADDRIFVSGVLKAVREKRLQIPVLPQAALEISRLLSDPRASASQFAKVLEADPGVSKDVLRIANSAYYGFSATTTSVRTAVVRVGLIQLRG